MAKSSQRPLNLWQKIWVIILGAVFIWLSFSVVRIISTYVEARNNRVSAENQKVQIESDIAEIHRKLDQIKTDQGIEEHIRLKYPFVKDGERVLIINPERPSEKKQPKGLWQKVKSIF
jgi:cell division protein FtsB